MREALHAVANDEAQRRAAWDQSTWNWNINEVKKQVPKVVTSQQLGALSFLYLHNKIEEKMSSNN